MTHQNLTRLGFKNPENLTRLFTRLACSPDLTRLSPDLTRLSANLTRPHPTISPDPTGAPLEGGPESGDFGFGDFLTLASRSERRALGTPDFPRNINAICYRHATTPTTARKCSFYDRASHHICGFYGTNRADSASILAGFGLVGFGQTPFLPCFKGGRH